MGFAIGFAAVLTGCMQWSPFETDIDDADRDVNAANLRRLNAHPAPGTDWSFAVLSDSHGYYDETAEMIRAINARAEVSFVVHLGDLSDDGLLLEYENTLRLLRRLTVPFFVVLGNHDTFSNGREIYGQMFGDSNFVIPYGTTRIVCFDSVATAHGGVSMDRRWVEGQLQSFEPDATVVLASHSDQTPDLAIRDERIGLVLLGHLHRGDFRERDGVLVRTVPTTEHRKYDRIDVTAEGLVVNGCDSTSCSPLRSE